MRELVLFLAKSLVDQPDAVQVMETEGPEAIILELTVAPEDIPFFVDGSAFDRAGLLEQHPHGFGGLGAVLHPLLGLFVVNLDFSGLLHRIVVTQFFDEAAIAGAADVRDHDAVEGMLFHAHSLETNFDSHGSFSSLQINVYMVIIEV